MGTDGETGHDAPLPATDGSRWLPNSLAENVARLEFGDRFDHVTRDPEDPRQWLIALKDGTTSFFKIGCARW